jgi:hypothetical protein
VYLWIHYKLTVPLLHAVAGSLLSLVVREFEPAAIAASQLEAGKRRERMSEIS